MWVGAFFDALTFFVTFGLSGFLLSNRRMGNSRVRPDVMQFDKISDNGPKDTGSETARVNHNQPHTKIKSHQQCGLLR